MSCWQVPGQSLSNKALPVSNCNGLLSQIESNLARSLSSRMRDYGELSSRVRVITKGGKSMKSLKGVRVPVEHQTSLQSSLSESELMQSLIALMEDMARADSLVVERKNLCLAIQRATDLVRVSTCHHRSIYFGVRQRALYTYQPVLKHIPMGCACVELLPLVCNDS